MRFIRRKGVINVKLLKKRETAIIVFVLAVIIATPLGMTLSLQRAANRVSSGFYNGVYLEDENYTTQGADSYFEDIDRNALGLIAVGSNYDAASSETAAVKAAREQLLAADTISEHSDANDKLTAAVEALTDVLQNMELSESDHSNFLSYSESFSGAEGALINSARHYNDSVEEFETDVLDGFPAGLIAKIFSVKLPETFGGAK